MLVNIDRMAFEFMPHFQTSWNATLSCTILIPINDPSHLICGINQRSSVVRWNISIILWYKSKKQWQMFFLVWYFLLHLLYLFSFFLFFRCSCLFLPNFLSWGSYFFIFWSKLWFLLFVIFFHSHRFYKSHYRESWNNNLFSEDWQTWLFPNYTFPVTENQLIHYCR